MINLKKLEDEQLKLAKKVITKDSFDKLELIGGVDIAYQDKDMVAAIVICDYKTMKVVEKVHISTKTKFPYIAGFLAYREGTIISETFAKLQNKPDVLLFDGNGILHPRRIGLASHLGVLLDQASIGVAKHLLIGEIRNDKVIADNKTIGMSFVSREHARPVYISPGHKISLKTSLEIVKNCMRFPHKLPEPLHMAHKHAKEKINLLNP